MGKIKVVLVDNDPDELFFMEKGFESSGLYTIVGQFPGGEETFEFLTTTNELPQLIVTDLNMPRINGNDIAREVSSNPLWKSIKIVVLSITSGDMKAPAFIENGSCVFLPKPSSLLAYQSFAADLHQQIQESL